MDDVREQWRNRYSGSSVQSIRLKLVVHAGVA